MRRHALSGQQQDPFSLGPATVQDTGKELARCVSDSWHTANSRPHRYEAVQAPEPSRFSVGCSQDQQGTVSKEDCIRQNSRFLMENLFAFFPGLSRRPADTGNALRVTYHCISLWIRLNRSDTSHTLALSAAFFAGAAPC